MVAADFRLATLTGVGGVGKTRLALHVASHLHRAFVDGVWLVDLAQVQDGALVGHTITQALRIHDNSGRDPLTLVTEFLRDRQLLLILDNCEHVIDDCATTVDVLLHGAEQLRVLSTSREVLRVAGEHTYQMSPLPVPGPEPFVGGCPKPPHRQYASISLFTQRAAAAQTSFAVTDDNRGVVADICCRLDGLPLALELAAARLGVLSVEQLRSRLDDLLERPGHGDRAGRRHATLPAAIDWSHQLCTAEEQLVWARASVFAGAFDVEAAERTCAGTDVHTGEVEQVLAALVEKSILLRRDDEDTVRYRMLDSIRGYGRKRLGLTGTEREVRQRHADWFRDLAVEAERNWFGPEQLSWFKRLTRNHAHLRTALDFYLETEQNKIALRLASALSFYWVACGLIAEGRHWLERALSRHTERDRVRAKGLASSGFVATAQGDLDASEREIDEAGELARRLGDTSLTGVVTTGMGRLALMRGETRRGMTLMEEALRQIRSTGRPDAAPTALILFALTLGHIALGEPSIAVDLSREAAEICRKHGDHTYRAFAHYGAAFADHALGRYHQATEHARQGLRLRREFPDPVSTSLNVAVIALCAEKKAAHERAAVLMGISKGICGTFGTTGLLESALFTPQHEACVRAARAALGDTAYEAAFRRGTEFTVDEGIAYALDETPGAGHPAERASRDVERPSPLTRRQAEVARLLSEGKTNKEIAARLMIADRTAETHVAHIMTKLGFTSRTQIATWVTQRLS